MKKLLLLLLCSLFFCLTSSLSSLLAITPEEAAAAAGQNTTVTGVVSSARKTGSGNMFINMGGAYPNQAFTIFIHKSKSAAFPAAESYAGKTISVTGMIALREGKAQIEAKDPAEIVFADGSTPAAAPAPATAATTPAAAPATPATAVPATPTETEPAAEATPVASEVSPAKPKATPTEVAKPVTFGGVVTGLEVGSLFTFKAPLNERQQKLAQQHGNKPVVEATVGLLVPEGFDPSKGARLMAVFSTSDGNGSNLSKLTWFGGKGVEKGFVCIAADGPNKPEALSNEYVWAMLEAGIDALEKEWPGIRTWPVVCAGNSGGGQRSGYLAGMMAAEKYEIMGIFMGSCNGASPAESLSMFRPPASFKKTPIMVTSGTQDTVATPKMIEEGFEQIEKAGFRNAKLEIYEGGHGMKPDVLAEALDWFIAEAK